MVATTRVNQSRIEPKPAEAPQAQAVAQAPSTDAPAPAETHWRRPPAGPTGPLQSLMNVFSPAPQKAPTQAPTLLEFGFTDHPGLDKPKDFARFVPGFEDLVDGKKPPTLQMLHGDSLDNPTVQKVLLGYFKTAQVGSFESPVPSPSGKPVQIRYAAFLPPEGTPIKGVLQLLNGRAESMLKNAELAYALRESRAAGYALVMADHRGQGFSDRLLDDSEKGYVAKFDDYLADNQALLSTLKDQLKDRLAPDAKWSAAGHSMGGAVLARYVETHPHAYDAPVLLISPMFGIPTGLPDWASGTVLAGLAKADVGTPDYVPSKPGPWAPEKWDEKKGSNYTGSETHLNWVNALESQYHGLALGSPTRQWANQAYTEFPKMVADAGKLGKAFMIRAPNDQVVVPKKQDEVASAANAAHPGSFTTINLEQGNDRYPVGHEPLIERDRIRGPTFAAIKQLMETGTIDEGKLDFGAKGN